MHVYLVTHNGDDVLATYSKPTPAYHHALIEQRRIVHEAIERRLSFLADDYHPEIDGLANFERLHEEIARLRAALRTSYQGKVSNADRLVGLWDDHEVYLDDTVDVARRPMLDRVPAAILASDPGPDWPQAAETRP